MIKSTVALVSVGQKLFLPTYFTTQLLLLFMHLTSFFSTIYRSHFPTIYFERNLPTKYNETELNPPLNMGFRSHVGPMWSLQDCTNARAIVF